MDLEYLGRSLNTRSYAAAEAFGIAKSTIMATAAAHGALGSGRTLLQFQEKALSIFTEKANGAAQFTYNLTETNDGEVAKQLDYCMSRMVEMISASVSEGSGRLGIGGAIPATQANKTKDLLVEKKNQLMDDFTHGMMGSEKLKKDPLLNVINHQTNSPGAIQQVGIGDNFSQTAFTQNHNELVTAIDRALVSTEFTQLKQDQKDAFTDTAVVVKEEASKPTPDVGKLKRWGGRLVDLSKDIGMKVAAAEIVHLLGKMFGA
jgi:hypothetical protein